MMTERHKSYMSSCNDLSLTIPDETIERQQAGRDVQHGTWRLLRCAWVDNGYTAIVSSEGKSVAAGGKSNTLYPTSGIIQIFATDSVERQTLTPSARLRAGVNPLDEAGEDASMRIGGSSCQQDGIWVPCQGCDGTANRLLEVLRDPPIILLLEVTDSNHSSPRANGKLLLRRRPAHEGGSTINSQKDKSGFPSRGGLLPNVSIAVCTAPVSCGVNKSISRI